MREVAMLITQKHFPLITVFGKSASVDFPVEYAMETNKKFPGLIRRMVHTHPEGAAFLSEEDRTTLKAWTFALAPHKIVMEVICFIDLIPVNKELKQNTIIKKSFLFRKMFWYELESLETWLQGDRSKPREMKLLENDLTGHKHPDWVKSILELSYLKEGE